MPPAKIAKVVVYLDPWMHHSASGRAAAESHAACELRRHVGTAVGTISVKYDFDPTKPQWRLQVTWTSRCRVPGKPREIPTVEMLLKQQG